MELKCGCDFGPVGGVEVGRVGVAVVAERDSKLWSRALEIAVIVFCQNLETEPNLNRKLEIVRGLWFRISKSVEISSSKFSF